MADEPSPRPTHTETTVQDIARVHSEHFDNAAPLQRAVNALTRWIGRPSVLVGLALAIALWTVSNLGMGWLGLTPIDPAPFAGLQAVATLASLGVSVMILASSRHADELATNREQVTLELSFLAERKTAKIIALLEEMRRDSPALHDRSDDDAEAMALPADPEHVLQAIRSTQPGYISGGE